LNKNKKENDMKLLFAILSVSLIISGCSSLNRSASNLVFPPHPTSDQRKGEGVQLELSYKDFPTKDQIAQTCKPTREAAFINEGLAIPGGAAALQFATEQVQEFLKKEAERYTGSYSAVAAGDHFYTSCNSAVNTVHLKGLTLNRSVKNVGNVMKLNFDIEPTIDGTAFQIKPSNISIEQSKAKVTAFDITRPFGFDLLAPWTIFQANSLEELSPLRPNEVDVTAEVSVIGVWVDGKQNGHSKVIATRKFKFGKVPVDGNVYPLGASPQLFPSIPRSYIGGGKLGAGNFIVSVLVTEYDDYAERVMELEQGVEKNREGLIERLTRGF
jgi:hypothetical protein